MIINIGRHFRSKGQIQKQDSSKIILGKNHLENKQIELLNKRLKYNIIISITPGPTVLFENKSDKKLA